MKLINTLLCPFYLKSQVSGLLIMILALIFCYATPVSAQEATEVVESKTISLDAKDTDIRDLLANLARAENINLIISDSVRGKVTVSLSGVSSLEAIKLILQANGFVAQEIDNLVIAGRAEEIKDLVPTVSKVIVLKYASASDLKQSLTKMAEASKVEIQADPRTNSIVIAGTKDSVQKLDQVIGLLDVEAPSLEAPPAAPKETRIFPLKYAKASDLRAIISEFSSPGGKVSVDDRTNSLVITDESTVIERLAKVIAQLDFETQKEKVEKEEIQIRVYNLNYIDANAIKPLLQELLPPEGKIQRMLRQTDSISPARPGDIGASSASFAATPSQEAVELKWSDTLVAIGPVSALDKIGEVISKLDTRSPQVRIEARIEEISLSDVKNIGINWQVAHSSSDSTIEAQFPINKEEGLILNIGTLSAEYFEDILAKLQALEVSGKAKLISNPSVIALDNELAQMIVADRIPIPKIIQTQFIATTSFEFINVGVQLTVIPHIAEDGYILMDVMPEVASIKQWTTGVNPQPIISSRMAHSRVRVKDGQTFAIGGLIKEEERDSTTRVPILGRIPLIGYFFRSKSADNARTDLVVFITPRIIKDE